MSVRRKVCVITGTRADYGLLYWLIKALQTDSAVELQLIVTGMHLSPEFGLTWRQIAADGFSIDRKIEMLMSSDTGAGVAKAMGVGLIGFADAYESLAPDIVVILGDRFEMLAAASAAAVARLPIAHIHGGESTEGAVDEGMRHAITKFSHLHFTAADAYRRRVIQLGESPDRVFNVGAPGIDNIRRLSLMDRNALTESLEIRWRERNLLITFHPATLEEGDPTAQMQSLLDALDDWPELGLIFTMPNADAGGRALIRQIEDYVAVCSDRARCFTSLGQLRYLSVMAQVNGVVGNSSSGLIEAPSMKVGTVNIGDRQRGRERAASVIDCGPTRQAIDQALARLFSPDFQRMLADVANPYGDGGASDSMARILRDHPLNGLIRKSFHDLPSK
jgi:GDP/UDP-N,N'-diacetylbacillosamine 2-epimerase (hydrolysing)